MKKEIIILFFISIVLLSGCERDEICIDPITPKLSIVFYDVDDPETKKSVNNLAVEILDVDVDIKSLDTIGTDSISVPLNIYAMQTTIVLTTNSKDTNLINQDTIRLNYETEEVFVGRSCGYKSIFKNVSIGIEPGNVSERWIQSLILEQTEIENENKAHVTILH